MTHIAYLQFYVSTPTPEYDAIAAALRKRGCVVWVGTVDEAGDLVWRDGTGIVAVQRGPRRLPKGLLRMRPAASILRRVAFWCFMLRVRRFLRQRRPGIVQVNPAGAYGVWLLPLSMPRQIRFVLDIRQVNQRGAARLIDTLRDRWVRWRWRLWTRYLFRCTCFLHPAGARVILGDRWPERGVVVPLGVDSRFTSIERVEHASNLTDAPVRFLYVGSLSRVRQLEQILLAVQWLLPVTNRFQVVLMGPDVDVVPRFYPNQIEKMGLASVVAVRPPVPYAAVPDEILPYDVALAYVPDYPADWRYHPTLKVLEYRALGMPIIATDFPPNREVVKEGVNGLLVPNSPANWAEAMLRFIADRGFLDACRANAQKMRRGTTWDEVAELYAQQVYDGFRPLFGSMGAKR